MHGLSLPVPPTLFSDLPWAFAPAAALPPAGMADLLAYTAVGFPSGHNKLALGGRLAAGA